MYREVKGYTVREPSKGVVKPTKKFDHESEEMEKRE